MFGEKNRLINQNSPIDGLNIKTNLQLAKFRGFCE